MDKPEEGQAVTLFHHEREVGRYENISVIAVVVVAFMVARHSNDALVITLLVFGASAGVVIPFAASYLWGRATRVTRSGSTWEFFNSGGTRLLELHQPPAVTFARRQSRSGEVYLTAAFSKPSASNIRLPLDQVPFGLGASSLGGTQTFPMRLEKAPMILRDLASELPEVAHLLAGIHDGVLDEGALDRKRLLDVTTQAAWNTGKPLPRWRRKLLRALRITPVEAPMVLRLAVFLSLFVVAVVASEWLAATYHLSGITLGFGWFVAVNLISRARPRGSQTPQSETFTSITEGEAGWELRSGTGELMATIEETPTVRVHRSGLYPDTGVALVVTCSTSRKSYATPVLPERVAGSLFDGFARRCREVEEREAALVAAAEAAALQAPTDEPLAPPL